MYTYITSLLPFRLSPERKTNISYINACMWNLEKWYRGTYLQGRNRDMGIENGHVGKSSGKGWDDLGDSYPTLCEPLDYSPPSSSVHEIFQARILEWVAISFLQGIFLTQGSNPHLLYLLNCRWIPHPLSHPGSPFCSDLGVLFLIRRGLWAQTTLRGHFLFGCPWPVLLRHLACPGVTSAFWIRDSPAPPDRKFIESPFVLLTFCLQKPFTLKLLRKTVVELNLTFLSPRNKSRINPFSRVASSPVFARLSQARPWKAHVLGTPSILGKPG